MATPTRTGKLSLLEPRQSAKVLLLLPFFIAVVAFGIRIQGTDWDSGNFFHPDERSIYMRADCMHRVLTESPGWQSCQNRDFPEDDSGFPSLAVALDKDRSPLNPHWFPLGTVVIYFLVVAKFVLEPLTGHLGLQDLASIARTTAALADSASVLLLFFLGKRLFGNATGLLASVFLALSVINIQVTHFYRPESFVVLLALAAFWWMINALQRARLRDHVGLGFIIGLTFAFRGSSLPILVPLAVTYGALFLREAAKHSPARSGFISSEVVRQAIVGAAAAVTTFCVLQPYAVLDATKYIGDLAWEAGIAREAGQVPYTLQYIGVPRTGWYELRQSIVWALGVPLGLAAWGGLTFMIIKNFVRPRLYEWLLISWVIALLLTVIPFFEVKFIRYIVPVLPVMILLGSNVLIRGWQHDGSRIVRRISMAVIMLVLVSTLFYAAAFVGIYRQTHPAVQAGSWLQQNAPGGSRILTDNHWDEGIPGLGKFSVQQLPMYESDTLEKVDRLSQELEAADFIVAYSNRPWGSISNASDRYPFSANYYQALFSGALGFRLEQGFTRYPSLLGVNFVHDPFARSGISSPPQIPGVSEVGMDLHLGWADENIVNYDRPITLVWRNESRLPQTVIREVIRGDSQKQTAGAKALFSKRDLVTQQTGGTWTDIFGDEETRSTTSMLLWLLVIELIYLSALPLVCRTLRWLPDRGVVLARPIGLLLVAWFVWIGSSYGVWSFGRVPIIFAVLLLAGISAAMLARNKRLLGMARRNWRYLVGVEILFLAAFLAFVAIRAANPDLWHPWRGGEKPMDLAYLTAVVRSSSFPPFDPWYAGGFINYYYFGFVMVGVLIHLTSVVPEIAYNLAIPMFFALTLSSAFSVGYNLTEALRQRTKFRVSSSSSVVFGLVIAILAAVWSNLDGGAQLAQSVWSILNGDGMRPFDFWRSSRLMPGQISITEFPFWTFLFGDMHPHLMSLPIQLTVIGLATNVVLGAKGSSRALFASGLALAFIVGSLAAINAWDLPAYTLIAVGAISIAFVTRYRTVPPLRAVGHLAAIAAVFWFVQYLGWMPFHQNYEGPSAGVRLSEWRTVAWHYYSIHALPVAVLGIWVFAQTKQQILERRASLTAVRNEISQRRRQYYWGSLLTMSLAALAVGLLVAIVAKLDVVRPWSNALSLLVIFLPLLWVSTRWLFNGALREGSLLALVGLIGLVGLGIGIGVDLVTVTPDIDRMNTVFKLFLNAWVFLSVVAGIAAWHLWASGALRWSGSAAQKFAKGLLGTILVVIVLLTGVFPVLGTRARVADRFDTSIGLTLDGRAYQRSAVYGDPGPSSGQEDDSHYALAFDADAIDFLRKHVKGSPVVLELASEHAYRWAPRAPRDVGLPTVIGWQWHQIQQRGESGASPEAIRSRIRDVRVMYETRNPEVFVRLADQYNVRYVYVGYAERAYYDEGGFQKFNDMPGVSPVFHNEGVTIYEIQ